VKNIQEIRQQLLTGNFEFTRHAFKRSIERNISKRNSTNRIKCHHYRKGTGIV
jgi:hypothetical protein